MGFIAKHIKRSIITLAAILTVSAGCPAYAQQLEIPERWTSAMSPVKSLFTTDTLTLRILGDVMMHEAQITNAFKGGDSYDFSSYFMFIEDEIRSADIAIANMEFTLAGKPYTGYPCFSAPDSFSEYIAECGFDILLAANNHIFDKGTAGTERTIGIYRELQEKHGIRFTGIAGTAKELEENNPLIIRKRGITLAILNFTYGTNTGLQTAWPETNYIGEKEKAEDAFSHAKKNGADFILAFPHWGMEYVLRHSAGQEHQARWFVENGADIIIGSHPHVVQDCGIINDVPVIYSLGNAVSNMSAANTQLELMATIRIVQEENGDLKMTAPELTFLWSSRPGGYNDSYTVIPVKKFIGRENEWRNPADYKKMLATYERVKKETNIND